MRLKSALLVGVFITASAIVSLPAGARGTQRRTISALPWLGPASQSLPAPTTYAADCATPKTTFNLGETVCAKVSGVTGLRFQWLDPDGFAVAMSPITADPQADSLMLPSTDQSTISGLFTANNLGRWRVSAVTSGNSAATSSFFTVKDPNNARVDLSIVESLVSTEIPVDGEPIQFAVTIVNNGPNDAVNTHFVDNAFTNATFQSLAQTSGPSFACSGTDCRIASFPNGAVATFVLNFAAGGSGGLLSNTVTVTSDTPELNPLDNSTAAAPLTVGTTGPPPTCTLVVTAPPSVTLFTGPGATSCAVSVGNLDATLGTGSATDSCPLAGAITRSGVPSGNIFPVGVTVVNYSVTDTEGNTGSAIQQVTVADNTAPTITCPPNITLEPTCPAGAMATWPAPIGTDNCSGATTTQTSGPANGSVFPVGTTSVTYTAGDTAGNRATCAFTVTVLTVSATVQNLETSIVSSSLRGPQKQGLLPKLDAVLSALNRGNINAACGPLNAFVNAVQSLIGDRSISAAQGQAWITSATHVANAIGCTSNPCS